MIPSPQSYSPGTAECHQVPSPPGFMHNSHPLSSIRNIGRDSGRKEVWFDHQNHDWNLNSSAFFWTQLQKEESHLRDVSDAVLLNTDGHGMTYVWCKNVIVWVWKLGSTYTSWRRTPSTLHIRVCCWGFLLHICKKLFKVISVSRGSCTRSNKCPQVMSLESVGNKKPCGFTRTVTVSGKPSSRGIVLRMHGVVMSMCSALPLLLRLHNTSDRLHRICSQWSSL